MNFQITLYEPEPASKAILSYSCIYIKNILPLIYSSGEIEEAMPSLKYSTQSQESLNSPQINWVIVSFKTVYRPLKNSLQQTHNG